MSASCDHYGTKSKGRFSTMGEESLLQVKLECSGDGDRHGQTSWMNLLRSFHFVLDDVHCATCHSSRVTAREL